MKVKNIKKLMILSLGFNAFYCILTILFILAQKIIRQVLTTSPLVGFIWPMDVLGINFTSLLISALFFYMMNKHLNARSRQRIITEIWCMIVFFIFPFFSQIASYLQVRVLSMRDGSDAIQIYQFITISLNWISVFASTAYILLFIASAASICYKLSVPASISQNQIPQQFVDVFQPENPEADL